MRRRRREHSLLLKASKILVSLGASVNLTLSHRRRALRSFPLARGGGIRPPPRETLMLRAPREIGVGISPQVEPGVSADENSKLGDGALHAESTLTLRRGTGASTTAPNRYGPRVPSWEAFRPLPSQPR